MSEINTEDPFFQWSYEEEETPKPEPPRAATCMGFSYINTPAWVSEVNKTWEICSFCEMPLYGVHLIGWLFAFSSQAHPARSTSFPKTWELWSPKLHHISWKGAISAPAQLREVNAQPLDTDCFWLQKWVSQYPNAGLPACHILFLSNTEKEISTVKAKGAMVELAQHAEKGFVSTIFSFLKKTARWGQCSMSDLNWLSEPLISKWKASSQWKTWCLGPIGWHESSSRMHTSQSTVPCSSGGRTSTTS